MIRKINIGFLILIALISCNTRKDINLKIEPPFNKLETPSINIKIDPSKEQVARFENGVSVEIPENAFVDIDGNVVQEEVILTLNSFNSPAEIIASGIPMTFFDDETSGVFESAGMFQLTGKTLTKEVFIDKDKGLAINYPSQVYGEYDFFQFEEKDADTLRTGKWIKLSSDNVPSKIPERNSDTFQLKFAINDYPELESLSSIKWQLATKFCNPTIDKNKWVLEQEWASIEISEPKYGFGDDILSSELNYDQYLQTGAILTTKDNSRIITSKKPITKIWSNKGDLIKTIDKVKSDYSPVEILNDKYLIIRRDEGDYIYNLDGVKLGLIPESYNRHLAKSKDIIVYKKRGTEPIVYISDITGKLIFKIVLREDKSNLWESGIYEHFILTPNDELITNSLDGINFYDLNGKQIKHKTGQYNQIEYIDDNTLLIECLDGTLIVWNFKLDKEIKSKKGYFDLRDKIKGNTSYSSGKFEIKNRPYVVINESLSNNSKLWNYETNSIVQLDFHVGYWDIDTLNPDIIVGYNRQDTTYHIYDLMNHKDRIKIPNLYSYNSESGYEYPVISENKKLLIVNSSSHICLYDIDGILIKDFKLYDSLITRCGFINNDFVFTLSEDGIYRRWTKNGVEVSSMILKNEESIYGWQYEDKIITWSKVLNNQSFYNLKGELFLRPGDNRINNFTDSTQILYLNKSKLAILNNLFELQSNVYQLILKANGREFITYIYLDKQDLEKINQYYTFRAKQIAKERNRQKEELKILRSFKINEFGIYNWDKIINQSNTLRFTADFKFNVPIEYSNITIFLVTEINGPAVFNFRKDSWGNFYMNPDAPNKLLAVLPDNKVAIFDDFDSIDFDKISKEKSFTFNMEISDKPITKLIDLEKILEK